MTEQAGNRRFSSGMVPADLGVLARMAWFAGQYALSIRQAGPLMPPDAEIERPKAPMPGWRSLIESMLALVRDDRQLVAEGLLPPATSDRPGLTDLPGLLASSRAYLADSKRVNERRLSRQITDLPDDIDPGRYPKYYLRNFHFQTDGYLSDRSAALYDWQVETLFTGTANLMRRQGLVPIARAIRGRDQRQMVLADIGCGTGSFLEEAAKAFPAMARIGIDLSRPYLKQAAGRRRKARRQLFIEALGEQIPLSDQSVDFVSAVYLFHELPAAARRAVVGELVRVVKPGGLIVIGDALQTGDRPDFDGLLQLFPIGFHEPFFESWTKCDLGSMFAEYGFRPIETRLAHLTKICAFASQIS